jgi:hypothetical protein
VDRFHAKTLNVLTQQSEVFEIGFYRNDKRFRQVPGKVDGGRADVSARIYNQWPQTPLLLPLNEA